MKNNSSCDRMKAICLSDDSSLSIKTVPFPEVADPEHLIIKVTYCGINPGDLALIAGKLPDCPTSMYNICGVSGVGKIIQIGKDVPDRFIGKNVAFYRSLSRSSKTIGVWSEYAHLHYTTCVILSNETDLIEYSGSLVNAITPYSFLEHINYDKTRAIIATAGNSATGLALLGICSSNKYPLISIVRKKSNIQRIIDMGGQYVLSQDDPVFEQKLEKLANDLNATVVFDGVGGSSLNRVVPCLPHSSTIYSYGFLGDGKPFDFPTLTLRAKDLTLTSFCVYSNPIVRNPKKLEKALGSLEKLISNPHFKTKIDKIFKFEEINNAINYITDTGNKIAIYPS